MDNVFRRGFAYKLKVRNIAYAIFLSHNFFRLLDDKFRLLGNFSKFSLIFIIKIMMFFFFVISHILIVL